MTGTDSTRFSPASERNSGPILEVLQAEFRDSRRVLEIGSGTGQHAVRFASALSHLSWQPSDLAANHAAIRARRDEAAIANLEEPLVLDVTAAGTAVGSFCAVFSANTAHIMSEHAVAAMFSLVGDVLSPAGRFCLYGPFREDGRFNAQSNADFDAALRHQDPHMGIRDTEMLDALADGNGLRRRARYAMPANNEIIVWEKTSDSRD